MHGMKKAQRCGCMEIARASFVFQEVSLNSEVSFHADKNHLFAPPMPRVHRAAFVCLTGILCRIHLMERIWFGCLGNVCKKFVGNVQAVELANALGSRKGGAKMKTRVKKENDPPLSREGETKLTEMSRTSPIGGTVLRI